MNKISMTKSNKKNKNKKSTQKNKTLTSLRLNYNFQFLYYILMINNSKSIYLLLLINTLASAGIVALQYQTSSYATMYSGNQISQQFYFTSDIWSCQICKLFTYNQTNQQYRTNQGYNLILVNFSQSLTVSISSKYSLLVPTINQTSCSANSACIIQILNNCPSVNYFRYFDIFQIYVSGIQNPLSYNVICNDSMPKNSFTWGEIILIGIAAIIITITALFSKAWSWKNYGLELNWTALIIINILLATGFSFVASGVNSLLEILQYSIQFLTFTLGSLAIMFCISQLLFLLPCFGLHKGINLKVVTFRFMDMIGLAIGVGLTVAWWFTNKNFVISDVISICILVATIKLVKFTSLKIAVVLYLTTSFLMIIFIIVIQVVFSASYQQKIAEIFYSPFLLVIPTITPVPNQQCSALYMVALAYPGIILSYIIRFDHSRSSRVYTVTFLVSFIFLSGAWAVLNVVSPFIIPFNLITIPVGLVIISLFSNRRNQFIVLWEGKFQDQQYKHSKTHIAQLMQIVKDEKSPSALTFKKSLLKGLYFRESNSSRGFSFLTERPSSKSKSSNTKNKS